jgi:membrane-bound serine protease (ClpP class)
MKRKIVQAISLVLFMAGFLMLQQPAAMSADEDAGKPLAHIVTIDGVIGPPTLELIRRNIDTAAKAHADVMIVQLSTPGGLYDSTQEIIKAILASPVPVVTYVSPTGSHAASAGTYILYGSHVAAMAPSTNIGAATPVFIMPGGMPAPDESPEKPNGLPKVMENKIINDASAFIRGLAERYSRNGEWAEKAVREAASVTATEALDKKIIEIIAKDIPDLLNQLDGRVVKMEGDRTQKLHTKDAKTVEFKPDWRTDLLGLITDPNIAFLLVVLGVYGLVFEVMHPGVFMPGVAGAISLLLGLYAMNVLPVNYAGLALIVLGIAMMVGEAMTPTLGALGIGGAISFAIGATILIDSTDPYFGIDIWLIAGITLTSLAIFSVLLAFTIKASKRAVTTGIEELKAATAEVLSWSQGQGEVRVTGEVWKAVSPAGFIIKEGDKVRVLDIEGLQLTVAPEDRT